MREVNIDLLLETLTQILSDRYGREVTVSFAESSIETPKPAKAVIKSYAFNSKAAAAG